MQPGIFEPRPPYIRFERRSSERRKLATDGGGVYFVDVDYALVTAHGSRDTVEKIVEEWFPRLQEETRQGRFLASWLEAYRAAYNAWKNDQEPPVNGTSIKSWPVASPAEVKMLMDLRVTTVEDLAQANEDLISRVGMGARALKQKAIDWLQAKGEHGPLVEQLEALRQSVVGLEARVSALTERNKVLQAIADSKTVNNQPPPAARPQEVDDSSTERMINTAVDQEMRL